MTNDLADRLLAIRPDFFARIAEALGVSRQHVARTARNPKLSKRVYKACLYAAKHRRVPW